MSDLYITDEYLRRHPPSEQERDSDWKAAHVLALLKESSLTPTTICDVGCGVGRVLQAVATGFPEAVCTGYDVSPGSVDEASRLSTGRLRFIVGDALASERHFDVAMALDVFEHVDDYLGFIRRMAALADYLIFHIPLDLTAQGIARGRPLMRVRQSVGHLHHFTKDTALASLEYAGLTIERWHYTTAHKAPGHALRTKIVSLPRSLSFRLAPDLAVRLLGGYSLIVLARRQPAPS